MQKKFDVGVLPLSSPSISVFAIPPSTKGRKCLRSAALRPLPQTWGRSSLRKLLPITLSYRYTQYVSTHLSTNQNHSQTPTFKREKSCNLFSAFGKSAVRSLSDQVMDSHTIIGQQELIRLSVLLGSPTGGQGFLKLEFGHFCLSASARSAISIVIRIAPTQDQHSGHYNRQRKKERYPLYSGILENDCLQGQGGINSFQYGATLTRQKAKQTQFKSEKEWGSPGAGTIFVLVGSSITIPKERKSTIATNRAQSRKESGRDRRKEEKRPEEVLLPSRPSSRSLTNSVYQEERNEET
ncbi:hypothetical protein Acr_00g0001540 [Actinidia rufa]|uniref:Uncharacterized protein n=1 Tax=Actinidia rufa TaxID=165716 RepID=A0A7J0D6N3_9ERIC|nr:hypothetical protein Acr_00g0001120 [Actinidia rufa]GFS28395.1 hypothetical protein Acr_00g0001540 [Actinidia rufa]